MFCTDDPGGQWLFYFIGKICGYLDYYKHFYLCICHLGIYSLVNRTHAHALLKCYHISFPEIKDLHLWEDVGVHEQPEEHGAGEE